MKGARIILRKLVEDGVIKIEKGNESDTFRWKSKNPKITSFIVIKKDNQ